MSEKMCVDLDLCNWVYPSISKSEREKRIKKIHLRKLKNGESHIYKGVKYYL